MTSIDQVLLNYDEIQLADFRSRSEALAHSVFDFAIEEHATKPDFYNKNPLHLQFKVAEFIKKNAAIILTQEEIATNFYVSCACVSLEMLKKMASESRNKNKRN